MNLNDYFFWWEQCTRGKLPVANILSNTPRHAIFWLSPAVAAQVRLCAQSAYQQYVKLVPLNRLRQLAFDQHDQRREVSKYPEN